MIEPAQLLNNMSAPSKSVVKYTGLSGSATTAKSRGTRTRNVRSSHDGVFGVFIVFRFEQIFRRRTPGMILEHLGVDPGPEPEKTLVSLIEQRARELTLPDACVVVPAKQGHPCPWPDPLAALAIITKSSGHVWLRSKSPRLTTIKSHSQVSLLIPPVHADRIEELSK